MKVSYVLSSLVKPFLPCLANCRLRCLDSGYCHVCSPGKYLCFFFVNSSDAKSHMMPYVVFRCPLKWKAVCMHLII